MIVPIDITARAPIRSMSRPTHVEMKPITSSATLKPRKTVRQGPSGLGDDRFCEDAETVVARAPGRDLRDARAR